MGWHLTLPGLIILIAMFALLLAGLHMIAQPGCYVGRGPIPARGPGNVRAMGLMFAILGGTISSFFTVPILLMWF